MSELPLAHRIKASLRQPKEECSFSIDRDMNTRFDDRCLSYYYLPEPMLNADIDLSGGYKDFIEKDESEPGHLNHFLRALMEHEKTTGSRIKGDIITFRGIMTKLLCLPYNSGDDIDLNLMVFDGQIFIEEDHELTQSKKRAMNERDRLMCYWGYKFEAISMLDKPWSEATRDEIFDRPKTKQVNNIEQYLSIVRTGVGSVKLVLAGEVDGVMDYKPEKPEDPLRHYVELKTSKVIRDEKDARAFERKILKTWAQSFLLGIRKVIYGFRDDNGILKSIEEYRTDELPTLVKSSMFSNPKSKWNGNDAVAFYAAAVEWIKNTVGTQEGVAWRLQYKRGDQKLVLYPLQGPEASQVLDSLILPEFAEWRKSLD
ncbi:hypothetical protein TRICI_002549 [Trichomonascus ciferrii]|uniref:Decapping nuclease n=1 Tax=Trichomonascus ciferrii TaxID=44093 RepID=A0A642VBY0_9ASCO|nr:hypothetical protein TRICI_002549 [Trichomonascus ciferrii]